MGKAAFESEKIFGQSTNTVYSQIWLALITYVDTGKYKGKKFFAGYLEAFKRYGVSPIK